jgi:hypothetical protein
LRKTVRISLGGKADFSYWQWYKAEKRSHSSTG